MENHPTSVHGPESPVSNDFALIREMVDKQTQTNLRQFLFAVGATDTPLSDLASRAITGGKRFRAICAYVGGAASITASGDPDSPLSAATQAAGMADLASAIEFYQASALVHDDLIDNSETRRGQPAAHVELTSQHLGTGGIGSHTQYGANGAILLGDLLMSAAEDALGRVIAALEPVRSAQLVQMYARMTGTVAQGQFRDMAAGFQNMSDVEADQQVEAALSVVRAKSAMYSVVHPAQLGALVCGADQQLISDLGAILEPAGMAFQLRDDALGAFGVLAETGKSNRSDIVERKRTVLLAMAYQNADAPGREALDRVYLSDNPDADDIEEAAAALWNFGNQRHEQLISSFVERAQYAPQWSAIPPQAQASLKKLVADLTNRSA